MKYQLNNSWCLISVTAYTLLMLRVICIAWLMAMAHSAQYFDQSKCVISKSKQLASSEKAASVSMEYSLESLTDTLSIYRILKKMDIRTHLIQNRTFTSVNNPILAEVFLGLQEDPYNATFSLEAGQNDYFLQDRCLNELK